MILKIFAVHDVKAEAYFQPFLMQSKGLAIRWFRECAQNKEHAFGKNPEDYTLFEVGTWDDSNCVYDQKMPLVPICKANELLGS